MNNNIREEIECRSFKDKNSSKEEAVASLPEFVERERIGFLRTTAAVLKPTTPKESTTTEDNPWKMDCYGVGEMMLMDGHIAITIRGERCNRFRPNVSGMDIDTLEHMTEKFTHNGPVRSWEESRALYLKQEADIDQYYRDNYSIKKYEDELEEDREHINYLHALENGMEDSLDQ